MEPLRQTPIRFATSSDGIRIFTDFYWWLGQRVRLIRFDQRGTSLSDCVEGTLRIDDMVEDMRAVADAAELERFFLFGPSQGVAFAIAFANRDPKRVLGIIGRGGFGRGWLVTGDEGEQRKYEGSKALIEAGWNANPEYRRFFTARLIPNCEPAVAREFDKMQRRACDAAAILANLELMVSIDVEAIAREVTSPAVLLHSRGDRSVAMAEGRRLASILPNAEFVMLDDDNHIFLPGTLGFNQATEAIDNFLSAFPEYRGSAT